MRVFIERAKADLVEAVPSPRGVPRRPLAEALAAFEEGLREAAALTGNATAIGDFVNSGGGLISHGSEYGWLSATTVILFAGLVALAAGRVVRPDLAPDRRRHTARGRPGVVRRRASLDEAADVIAGYQPHRERPSDLSGLRKNLRHGEDGPYRAESAKEAKGTPEQRRRWGDGGRHALELNRMHRPWLSDALATWS